MICAQDIETYIKKHAKRQFNKKILDVGCVKIFNQCWFVEATKK